MIARTVRIHLRFKNVTSGISQQSLIVTGTLKLRFSSKIRILKETTLIVELILDRLRRLRQKEWRNLQIHLTKQCSH